MFSIRRSRLSRARKPASEGGLLPPPSLPVCKKSVSQAGLMCPQFLGSPFRISVNQNWKSWPDNYLGRLWILRDAFSGTTSVSGGRVSGPTRAGGPRAPSRPDLSPTSPIAAVGTTSPPPKWIKPQLTRLVDEAPTGKDGLHEIKYDGYRMQAARLVT